MGGGQAKVQDDRLGGGRREVDQIDSFTRQFDQGVAAERGSGVVDVTVIAGSPREGVIPQPANQTVVASRSVEAIVPAAAGQHVGQGIADQQVGPNTAGSVFKDRSTLQLERHVAVDHLGRGERQVERHIRRGAGEVDQIGTTGGRFDERVGPERRVGIEQVGVVAGSAREGVIPGTAHENVDQGVAAQGVIVRTADDILECCGRAEDQCQTPGRNRLDGGQRQVDGHSDSGRR